MSVDPSSVPDFDDLPVIEGMPQGCAWGVFDRDGKHDLLGTLNWLTPGIVKAAASEVQDGISISLNWPINAMAKIPTPGRPPPQHKVLHIPESMGSEMGEGWDDELTFNTQCSSQWDSLCHFQHQKTQLAYNGAKPAKIRFKAATTAENIMPTIDHWHERGGLVARGVLIDYAAYAEEKGIQFHPFAGIRIKVEDLEACAKHQGVAFRPGDVLIVRTGATEFLESMDTPSISSGKPESPTLTGVHGSEETARWIWNKRFSAVASDSNAFEAWPPVKPDGTPSSTSDLVLHQYLLSMFGMSIGELWDLKKLSKYCKEKKRYTFMLTSAPLNHPCLIASPPNALAIF